jgi:arylsulfatase A-like enzyme
VRIPGGPKGKVDSIVGLTDLMPTVLDVLDLHGSAEYLDGTNLLSAMHRTESRPAYSEYLKRSGAISRAWTTDRYKLIIDAIQRRIELYDLVEDPTESFNLARQLPDVRATLQEQADLRPLAGHSRVLTETESLDFLAIDLVYLQRNGVVLQALNRFTPADAERFRESLEELARREYLDDAVRDRLNELGISTP